MTWEGERALSKKLMDANVFLATGESFHSDVPGWFRIIFTLPRDQLEEGLRRIVSVLNSSHFGAIDLGRHGSPTKSSHS